MGAAAGYWVHGLDTDMMQMVLAQVRRVRRAAAVVHSQENAVLLGGCDRMRAGRHVLRSGGFTQNKDVVSF